MAFTCVYPHTHTYTQQPCLMHVFRREQIFVGRKMVVSHPISKFRDGVTTGITFDRGIQMKLPFYQFAKPKSHFQLLI